MIDYKEASKMSANDLKTKVVALKAELFNAKFSKHTVGVDKPHAVKGLKKDIARLLTALNAKKN